MYSALNSSNNSLVVHVWPVIDGIRTLLIVRPKGSSSSSISHISKYTLSDFGDLSNLIGSLPWTTVCYPVSGRYQYPDT